MSAHNSVLYQEAIDYMAPQDGKIYVDGTFGAGGHSRGLLAAADCKVYAIDRDPSVQPFADALAQNFPGRIKLLKGEFGNMEMLLNREGITEVDGILLDVGVSSMQLDTAERGFSFRYDAPLDMRMSQTGRDAAMLVNEAEEGELADIIYQYGGERKSRRIAKAIVLARAEKPVTRTSELANIIRKALHSYNDKIDPATRTFQAIRIWVNDELGEISRALAAAEKLLTPGGRLVVISFHSLEDRLVKDFINKAMGKTESVSRYVPATASKTISPSFEWIVKKAVKPSQNEIKVNPRARSAKLRAARRTNAPARSEENL